VWQPKNKIVIYFWDILTVSFAAQIGTFPLSVYYFHQFPGLFFVTNLVVIPFLSVIMGLGVVVIIWAAFTTVLHFLLQSLEWSIYVLNKTINSIASLEQFVFQDLSFNWQLMLSVYLLLIFAIVWFKNPSFNRLVMMLISVFILQTTYSKTHWTIQ